MIRRQSLWQKIIPKTLPATATPTATQRIRPEMLRIAEASQKIRPATKIPAPHPLKTPMTATTKSRKKPVPGSLSS